MADILIPAVQRVVVEDTERALNSSSTMCRSMISSVSISNSASTGSR